MRIKVEGGYALNGIYTPSGSANAAAACLAAALLTSHPVTLSGVPHTTSTESMLELAGFLGAQITGGSWSTMMNFDAMSRAGAAGRAAT